MLKLSWAPGPAADRRADAAGNGQVLVMVSKLELRSALHVVPFLLSSLAIRRQTIRSAGGVGHALAVEPGRKVFWTQSAWTDRKALQAFNTAEPHAGIVARFKPRMKGSVFSFFTADGPGASALDWGEVQERLDRAEAGRTSGPGPAEG